MEAYKKYCLVVLALYMLPFLIGAYIEIKTLVRAEYGFSGILESLQKYINTRTLSVLWLFLAIPLADIFILKPNPKLALDLAEVILVAVIGFVGILFYLSNSSKHNRADYRKKVAEYVISGRYNALVLFDKLDEEVKRNEMITYNSSFYALPSAIVTLKSHGLLFKPCIVPTDSISSAQLSSDPWTGCKVFLFDEYKNKLCALPFFRRKKANALMLELNRRFGVRIEDKVHSYLRLRILLGTIVYLIIFLYILKAFILK